MVQAVLENPPVESTSRLVFRERFPRRLDALITRVRGAASLDVIQRELAPEIAMAFGAQRLTIYVVTKGRGNELCLESHMATGFTVAGSIRLPVSPASIAGYVASEKCVVNVADAYDASELRAIDPQLGFNPEVDRRTGFITRQTLCAPIMGPVPDRKRLLGVIQLLNFEENTKFPDFCENGIRLLSAALGQVLVARLQAASEVSAKYKTLMTTGVLSIEEFAAASKVARDANLDVEEVLVRDFAIPVERIGAALAQHFGIPYEPYRANRVRPSAELLGRLKRDFVQKSLWLPLEQGNNTVRILCVDPDRAELASVAQQLFRTARLQYCVTTRREFFSTMDQFFPANPVVGLDEVVEAQERHAAGIPDVAALGDSTLVATINRLIMEAHRAGASDLHFEPHVDGDQEVEVRIRRDGIMHNFARIPKQHRAAVVSRLKVMAGLDISERRVPQDGKIQFKLFAPLDIELRISTMPTYGEVEDVVLRLLSVGDLPPLDQLGLAPDYLATLRRELFKPHGLLLVTGPTGCGKTTTLHSSLAVINTPEKKIWTVEDPVEYVQPGLRQVAVNSKMGRDFEKVMRSFVRNDPDVIMVGEIRDLTTAATAIEASLTGHLVMSTLHTNSASEAATRLIEMGMDPYNFSYALLGVLGQRLVRRLCAKCRRSYVASRDEIDKLVAEYCAPLEVLGAYRSDRDGYQRRLRDEWYDRFAKSGEIHLNRSVGCQDCLKSGYRTRIGVHELLLATPEVKERIQAKAPVSAIFGAGLEQGMRSLKQDGILKVLSGITDMPEIRRVAVG